MTGHLVPPRPGEQLSRTKGRVHDLERRLQRASAKPLGYVAKFSLHGELYESLSGVELHPTGGRLQLVYAVLDEAGDDTTELDLLKNGTRFQGLKLPGGVAYNEVVVANDFNARTDEFQVEIVAAGLNAVTITVYGLFDT